MRSKLFVPGSRPELFPKALASAADALSFDLEDAVPETGKAEARRLVGAALQSPEFATSKKIFIVRVNALTTPHFAADLAAIAAKRLGYIGKSCIHPSQVAVANDIFLPTEAEVAFARRVIEAAALTNAGAFTVDGRMIDAPFLKRAHAVVAIARQFTPPTS